MAIHDIVYMGDPVLRTEAAEVTVFDDNLRTLVRDMFEIIDEDRGGLITIQELHQTIREIGQELSVDDARARAYFEGVPVR